jgi:membrane fusion protein (multidrug efflux system)
VVLDDGASVGYDRLLIATGSSPATPPIPGIAGAGVHSCWTLADARAISSQEYVNAQSAQAQAEADVASAQAALRTTQLNLGYASVTAPISGRIGRALVTEGALVGQGEATPLAVVQQIDPLFVNFTQPAAEVLRLRAAIANGQLRRAGGPDAAAVRLVLEDGSVHPLPGKLLFSELSVDAGTGQITLRAEVPNPKAMLLPGLFVRVRFEQAEVPQAMLLPQQAVLPSNQGYTVMVVGAEGKVNPRAVKVGPAQGGQWAVLEGLQAGEQVMADGFQKLRPNVVVKAVPWRAPAAAGSPLAAASAPAPVASAATPASATVKR